MSVILITSCMIIILILFDMFNNSFIFHYYAYCSLNITYIFYQTILYLLGKLRMIVNLLKIFSYYLILVLNMLCVNIIMTFYEDLQ